MTLTRDVPENKVSSSDGGSEGGAKVTVRISGRFPTLHGESCYFERFLNSHHPISSQIVHKYLSKI